MDDIQADATLTAAGIEETFGGRWGVWLSDTGTWWASYRCTLNAAEQGAGCVPFVRADNARELVEAIRTQERLLRQAAPESAGRGSTDVSSR